MKRYSYLMVPLLACALLLIGSSQSWAVGTAAEQVISNQASVQFTINGSTTTKDSNTETFTVDRKIRMVVTSNGDATVVGGVNGYVLPFTVTNESNTKVGDTDYFRLQISNGTSDDFDMNNVSLYLDSNGNGLLDAAEITAGPLFTGLANAAYVSIGNTTGSNSAQYLIVADCPPTGGSPDTATPGITADYNLVATTWAGNNAGAGQLAADPDATNNKAASEVVYADGPGTSAGDAALNGQHSEEGTYTTLATIGVAKATVGNGTSGYHIPGDVVTYDIDVTNGDPSYAASNVIVTDNIPANTTYNEFTLCAGTKEWNLIAPAGWTSTDPGNGSSNVSGIRCTILNLAASPGPGNSTKVTFKVTIN